MTSIVLAEPAGIRELEAARAGSPFATAEYVLAMDRLSYEPWIVLDRDGTPMCAAFVLKGRIGGHLLVPSLPVVSASSDFWESVEAFATRQGVTDVVLQTFASPPGVEAPGDAEHRTVTWRQEFVVDLAAGLALGTNHRRNVRKSTRAGLHFRWASEASAMNAHVALRADAVDRRVRRGEVGQPIDGDVERALLAAGAGILGQAVLDDDVVSSIFLLKSRTSAYYRSAGTSQSGRSTGASPGLIAWVADELQREGMQDFFLGGAPAGSTLERFKLGFGADGYPLPKIKITTGSKVRRTMVGFLRRLRE